MITDCRTDEGTVVLVCGELDVATAPLLNEHLLGLIGAGHHVVLDLASVEFMDSSGLEVLVTCYSRAELFGSGLVLRRPSYRVRRLLELTGLTSYFGIEGQGPPVPRPR